MFNLPGAIPVEANLQVDHRLVVETLAPILTDERRKAIERVVAGRCFDIAIVMESIYDRGNTSAVMRTGEGLGFANFHVIETQEKFKEANRVTQGADKWVETRKWKSTKECVQQIKAEKKQLVVTALTPKAVPLSEIDFSIPTALVLGNEKEGASPEMIEAADKVVIIPMSGFVQSFNISVAGALCMYHIQQDRQRKGRATGDLTDEQKSILTAHYYLRTLGSGLDILKSKFQTGRA